MVHWYNDIQNHPFIPTTIVNLIEILRSKENLISKKHLYFLEEKGKASH